jgi:hypothetical protein
MRKILQGLLFLTAAGAWTQPRPEVGARRFDFGEVDKGEKVTHSFLVRNAGADHLLIRAVAPA